MWKIKDPNRLIDAIGTKVLRAAVPEMVQRMKEDLKKPIDSLVTDNGQTVENDYSSRYQVNNRQVTAIFTINLGSIGGNREIVAGGSKRKTHTRTYQDESPFQLPNGDWVTSKHIPAELAREHAYKALGYNS
jgi:hypothetical protein